MSASDRNDLQQEVTMDAMPATTPAHAKPARGDLLWVLVLILACGLLEVWASWLQIGARTGFPKLGGMTTGWILPVTSEAYWGAALFAWLATPAGPRSKRFAMWSAAAVFALSLCGQESDHLMAFAGRSLPPVGVVMFVTALPLISVALIAILIHLRQKDREETATAGRQAAEVSEIARLSAETAAWKAAWGQVVAGAEADREAAQAEVREALRADLEAAQGAREEAQAGLVTARSELARVTAKAEALERKLGALKPKRTRAKPANAGRGRQANASANGKANAAANTPANERPNADPGTSVPDDFDARTEALGIWMANPKISGKDLGTAVGLGARWGQLRKNEFAAAAPAGQDPEE